MTKFIKKALIILNIIAVIFLIFAYLSAYVSPADFSFFAFFGLIYPFLLIINILFIVYWLFKKNKLFIISTLTILIGWSFLTSFFQLSFNKKKFNENEQQVKVLSFNVRVFNLWNWSTEKSRAYKTYKFIKESKSNIVCLQEFYSSKLHGKNARDSLLKASSLKYAHISFAKKRNKIYHHGIATFTSYPIIEKGKVQLENFENFCIYTDIKIDKDTIRIYNVHLESIHLGHSDYQAIDNLNNDTIVDVVQYKNILKKFRTGYIKRSRQVDIISAHINKSPYSVIVCGDFNDPPFSYSYHRITRNLKDSFKGSGNGISSTYIHKYSTYRIDYILHSSSLKSFNFRRLKVELSDHYPIESIFQIAD